MTKSPKNNGRKTDGTFAPGNALGGKTKGARHRATKAVEELLDGQVELLTQKAVDAALSGDMTAMRLCLERICPPRKSHPIEIELPKVETAGDVAAAHAVVIGAMARGEVTPDEASTIASVLEAKRRSIETCDIENRLEALEKEKQK